MKYTKSTLEQYVAPIGKTENEKCLHAIEMIRDALMPAGYQPSGKVYLLENMTESLALNMIRTENLGPARKLTLLVQGSYANKTNIQSESDVDVAVILETGFAPFTKSGPQLIFEDKQQDIKDCIKLKYFKNEVEEYLRRKFPSGVSRHNKSLQVKGNTYRVDADVVPCGRYNGKVLLGGTWYSVSGIRIQPDTGRAIINYPEHHIRNGVAKNAKTKYQFKKNVRIMKHIKANMEACGWTNAKKMSSFAIESLLWNMPAQSYSQYPSVVWHSFNTALVWLQSNKSRIKNFLEINGIKSFDEDDSARSSVSMAFLDELSHHYDYDYNT